MSGVVVDIGTGDGEFAFKLAKDNPDKFVVGIDPNHKGLVPNSLKVSKKPQKGGLENVLYVLSDAENLPEELNNLANQVFINLPWAGLLKDLVLVKPEIWQGIKRICAKDAVVDILVTFDKNHDSQDLPQLDLDYINFDLLPKLEGFGYKTECVRELVNEDLKNYPSSWAKKLSFGKDRKFYYFRLRLNQ